MTQDALIEELTQLQCLARAEGLELAFAWLGREIARLLEESKPKRRRPRGRWVRLAATGERAFLDARVVEAALREAGENDGGGGSEETGPRALQRATIQGQASSGTGA